MTEDYTRTPENIRLEKTLADAIVKAGQPNKEVAAILAHAKMKTDSMSRFMLEQNNPSDIESVARKVVEGFAMSQPNALLGWSPQLAELDEAKGMLIDQHKLDAKVVKALTQTLIHDKELQGPTEMVKAMLETHRELVPERKAPEPPKSIRKREPHRP